MTTGNSFSIPGFLVLFHVILGYGVVAQDTCSDVITNQLCSIPEPSALAETCGLSYGYCPDPNPKPKDSCSIEAPSINATLVTEQKSLKPGEVAEYKCKKGYVPHSGDTARNCTAGGLLSGTSLKCQEDRVKDCPGGPGGDGWSYFESTKLCYKYFDEKLSFMQATGKCELLGCQLAMPKTQSVNDKIIEASFNQAWIGLDDNHKEGHFVWRDGLHLKGWSNWQSPKSGAAWHLDCAVIKKTNKGQWDQFNCNSKIGYVCQCPLKDERLKFLEKPQYNDMALPFIAPIPAAARSVTVEGISDSATHDPGFRVELVHDLFHPRSFKMPLVINPRIKRNWVIRTIFNGVNWNHANENRAGSQPFKSLKPFKLTIDWSDKTKFRISVDDVFRWDFVNKLELPGQFVAVINNHHLTRVSFQ